MSPVPLAARGPGAAGTRLRRPRGKLRAGLPGGGRGARGSACRAPLPRTALRDERTQTRAAPPPARPGSGLGRSQRASSAVGGAGLEPRPVHGSRSPVADQLQSHKSRCPSRKPHLHRPAGRRGVARRARRTPPRRPPAHPAGRFASGSPAADLPAGSRRMLGPPAH